MLQLFHDACNDCSTIVTKKYSTSFSLGIRLFSEKFRQPIYGIYGFVRFADEIVDTFYNYPQKDLLKRFKIDTYQSISDGISLNPILQSFQKVVNQYNIEHELVEAFFNSMETDLYEVAYENQSYQDYIYGSAEVVGLMCLRVFCENDNEMYNNLKASAKSLGAAFQKINFLRDIKSDFEERGRTYFPDINFESFTDQEKKLIEKDIQQDFDDAYVGIIQLPKGVRLGVYLAYIYYTSLFKKIKNLPASSIMEARIRVKDTKKMYLLLRSTFIEKFNLLKS
jgi:phytoene/squalene synthetase